MRGLSLWEQRDIVRVNGHRVLAVTGSTRIGSDIEVCDIGAFDLPLWHAMTGLKKYN